MRRAGWNVLVPHYRGSWGSAGTFSFTNAIEDTQAAVQFLRDPENAKKYRTDASKIVVIGHSMGGFLRHLCHRSRCGDSWCGDDFGVEPGTRRRTAG